MKIRILSLALLAIGMALSLVSCKDKKPERPQGPQPTKFEQAMKAKDTLEVKALVDRYFTLAKEEKFDEAASMVYRNDRSRQSMPEALDAAEKEKVIRLLKSVPMKSYEIEYIKFDKFDRNEVLCNVIIAEAQGDMPAVKTKMFFKPVKNGSEWVLCLMDTEHGDKGVVAPDKRDSVERNYVDRTASEPAKDKE